MTTVQRRGGMVTAKQTTYCACGHADYEHKDGCFVRDYFKHTVCSCAGMKR